MRLKYFIYILLFLTLSCVKEKDVLVAPDGEVTATIPFTAVVHGSQATRASINGPFGTGDYIFQTGDRLFVVDTDTGGENLYGVLTLADGADSDSGTFEGTLNCVGLFSPANDTDLSATLVGPDAVLYEISDDKITATTYPSSIAYEADGLEEYVKKYSNFTSSSTYGEKSFTLEQQSVFLLFDLYYFRKNNPSATTGTVSLYADEGGAIGSLLYTVTDVVIGTSASPVGNANFVTVVPAGFPIAGAHIMIDDDLEDEKVALEFTPKIANQALVANTYYRIARSRFDGFRIKATEGNTTITFNYYDESDGIKYSRDGGKHWIPYTSHDGIILENVGDQICVVGNRTNYRNALPEGGTTYGAPSDKPIFVADEKCYIAGNIMSLLKNETLTESAFQGAFSKGSKPGSGPNTTALTYIDIDPADPLTLPIPDNGLPVRCYKVMFRNCTSLTHAPYLLLEDYKKAGNECYASMFRECENLLDIYCYLNSWNGEDKNKSGNYNRPSLQTIFDKWSLGITSTGTFYCHQDMILYWQNSYDSTVSWYSGTRQFAGRPNNWSVVEWTPTPTP